MDGALADLLDGRAVALPLHDGIIVPVSAAATAKAALEEACRAVVGITPRVKVD
jgi:hypothetical protein